MHKEEQSTRMSEQQEASGLRRMESSVVRSDHAEHL